MLENKPEDARLHLDEALAKVRERWEPETTANSLRPIREARRSRGVKQPWLNKLIAALEEASQ